MIITRTPFRISFAGGGSDLPAYYEHHGNGAVVSVTIDKYVYLSLHPYFENNGYLLKYSEHEKVNSLDDIQHRIIKQVFSDYDICGVDFNSSADIPSGTGMGSSSAFTSGLALLANLYKTGHCLDHKQLASYACDIELNKLKEPIGKQDQYACASGGLNFIEFCQNGTVEIEKLSMDPIARVRLENNLLLFYTGKSRSASAILAEQSKNTKNQPDKAKAIGKMVELARELRSALLNNQIDVMGELLHANWLLKRNLAGSITNPDIDRWYELARQNGASGGKLLGAGGSGFLLFYAKEENHERLRSALSELREIPFKFSNSGSTVIYQQ